MSSLRKHSRLLVLVVLLVLLMPGEAHAYIGPGAGFAVCRVVFRRFSRPFFLAAADLRHLHGRRGLLKRTIFGWRSLRRSWSAAASGYSRLDAGHGPRLDQQTIIASAGGRRALPVPGLALREKVRCFCRSGLLVPPPSARWRGRHSRRG